jgi:hypothetical protein
MDERERLRALLDACDRILPGLDDEDELATQVRETCAAVARRLAELEGEAESPVGGSA